MAGKLVQHDQYKKYTPGIWKAVSPVVISCHFWSYVSCIQEQLKAIDVTLVIHSRSWQGAAWDPSQMERLTREKSPSMSL